MKARIYVAGAFSSTDTMTVFENMRKGINECAEILSWGLAPFCPWLDYQLVLAAKYKLTVQDMRNYSLKWLEVSDIMYVLSGFENSEGTKAEIKHAEDLGVPIVYSLEDLLTETETLFKTW